MARINKSDIQLIGSLLRGELNDKRWDIAEKGTSITYSEEDNKPTFRINQSQGNSSILQTKEFFFISNSDKSIRWIWPKELSNPSYLNFYCANNLKSKVYVFASRILFKLGLEKRLSSGSIIVKSKADSAIEKLVKSNSCDAYSIFLGTTGPNRKIIVECGSDGKTEKFIKIPVGIRAKILVQREAEILESLDAQIGKNFTPQVLHSSEDYLVQSNHNEASLKRPHNFSEPQSNFLKQLYLNNTSLISPVETTFISKADERVNILSDETVRPELKELWKRLKLVRSCLDVNSTIPMSRAHGDFTPWNMFEAQDGLYVYDWEMALDKAPLFYDLFHFEFQKGILQDRKSFYEILSSIEKKITDPIFSRELNIYPVDWSALLKLYLYHISSYYLSVYQSQSKLHMQVSWLVEVWNDGLDWASSFVSQKMSRKRMALNLFKHLNQQSLPYAWLKSRALPIDALSDSSDIDILIKTEDYQKIYKWLEMHPACSSIHELRQSFMSTLILFLNTGETLFIDLLWGFKRKHKSYLLADQVLENRICTDENIYIASAQDDLTYCLNFYQQNGSGVPEHYLDYFISRQVLEENEKAKYAVFNPGLKAKLENSALGLAENKGFSLLRNISFYLSDIVKRIRGGKGMVISFSGVDGAGKSTVLESTRKLVENRYRRNTIVLRHRPSFLPILSAYKYGKKEAEQRAADTLPRQGTNSSTLSSILRFIYYYTDYLIGQWIIYVKYVMRGYVVLYDRYYFDFINDPKRANLNLTQTLPLMLSGFIIKPDLNFLLTAPADVILERKQELTKPAIETLTEKYSAYFKGLSDSGQGQFIRIENIDLEKTINTIERHFKPVIA